MVDGLGAMEIADDADVRFIPPREVGPDGDKPAYDDTIQAECGISHVQGLMNGEPGFAATIMADKIAGLHALYATLAALFHRSQTGEGQEVEV